MKRGRRPLRRTMAALLLTALAVAAPCGAWFAVGWREARQRAADLADAPRRQAHEIATRLAERLQDRLETLRANESNRPFYHYQNLYHDPRGAYEGMAVVPSPLAQGPLDPLIRTYFQLDASGRFTLPQLTETGVETVGAAPGARAELQTIRQQLELLAPTFVFILGQQQAAPTGPRREEILDATAYAQNVQAAEVYFSLRHPERATGKQQDQLQRLRSAPAQQQVVISIGPLRWHALEINRVPSLLALRDVLTPLGRQIQGFLISADGLAEVLKASPFPAQFLPGPAAGPAEVAVRLDDTVWHIAVDARLDLADARNKARAVRLDFLRTFFGGVAFASLAGVCVVWLVWRSDQLARQRSQFAASAAHELRTPLAGLRLYSDMLADGFGDPGKARDYARRVADEAERLGRVVANVLGFSRLERGTLQVHPQPGDLAAAVRDAVARQQPALTELGVTVELLLPENLPAVRFDSDAVAQILQNLLDNAEKHTRSATNRTVHVALAVVDGAVELSVTDHGPGVPRRARRRLFRPFQRGNETDSPAGIGLGLTLVKALAQAQGGTAQYRDAAGGGACFAVRLPV